MQAETHEQLTNRVGGYVNGALTTNLIVLGDKLGLYSGLKDLGKATPQQLADHLQLKERWVREWLFQQAAGRLITTDAEANQFWLTKVQEDVLANEYGPDASPYYLVGRPNEVPPCVKANDALVKSFKSGLGLRYDEYGTDMAVGVCRDLNVWVRHFFVEKLSTIPGLREALERGIHVADIGCGCGEAALLLARAFPASTFHGYDISTVALEAAEKHKGENGQYANVEFLNPGKGQPMPSTPTYDFMYTMDAIHDMAYPDRVLSQACTALKENSFGYLICDFNGKDTPGENIHEDPEFSQLLYAYSVHLCMSSALSEPKGMGLGTLGFTKPVAKKLTADAGFSSYEELDFNRPEMRFCLVKR